MCYSLQQGRISLYLSKMALGMSYRIWVCLNVMVRRAYGQEQYFSLGWVLSGCRVSKHVHSLSPSSLLPPSPVNVCTLCLSMYAWMLMCMHGYADHNPLYLYICVCLCVCVFCSHTCMHVHICGICMCVGVLTHVSVYGDQQLMSGCLQFLSHLNLWDRFSHWTCSWPFCLGWLVSKPRGSSCVCSLVLGLYACLTMPNFSLGAEDPNSILHVYTEALYLLSQLPRL